MVRPIELERSRWCTIEEAARLSGRDYETIRRWVAKDAVRWYRDPGGRRVFVFKPDVLPPEHPSST